MFGIHTAFIVFLLFFIFWV